MAKIGKDELNGLYCEICGKPLTGIKRNYCSKKCANISHCWLDSTRKRKLLRFEEGKPVWEFNCNKCGKAFETTHTHETLCVDCTIIRNRPYANDIQPQKTKKYCKVCGKPLSGRKHAYCSAECRKMQILFELNRDPDKYIKVIDGVPRFVTKCKNCGKEFVFVPRGKTRYCSDECGKAAQKRHMEERRQRLKRKKALCQSCSIGLR